MHTPSPIYRRDELPRESLTDAAVPVLITICIAAAIFLNGLFIHAWLTAVSR